MAENTAENKVKRHPIRGALYGLLLGVSVWYFLQFEFDSLRFDSIPGVAIRAGIVVVAAMLLGVVWAYVAPARKPKGAAPVPAPPPAVPGADADTAETAAATSDLPSEDE